MLKKTPPGAKFTYISLGHWVPKTEAESSFRLVTDFRQLNEAVEVETSTFPTQSEVMISIDPSRKFWVVADLTSVYHQIKIPPTDEHLFGVLLEYGLYVYGRKLMGFINSRHLFVNIATSLLEGTEAMIEVDDVIIGRKTMEELIVKFKVFLKCCR